MLQVTNKFFTPAVEPQHMAANPDHDSLFTGCWCSPLQQCFVSIPVGINDQDFYSVLDTCLFMCGLLFNKGRDLSTGHFPSSWDDSSGHSLTIWPTPPYTHHSLTDLSSCFYLWHGGHRSNLFQQLFCFWERINCRGSMFIKPLQNNGCLFCHVCHNIIGHK
jgi:hypothetical protein